MSATGRPVSLDRAAAAGLAVAWLLPLALWAALAVGLSQLTSRVADWFVMTDELFYERLAISVFVEGTPLPYVHGELIANLNQLYPLLLAPVFRNGLVGESLHDAHVLNAWVMSSACIPAYLLTRRLTGRVWASSLVAALTVCVPWITLSSFLLTEVAAYPAFLWAILALHRATAEPSRRGDALLLLAVAVAVLARAQLLFLVVVAPAAINAHVLAHTRGPLRARLPAAAGAAVRSHPVLAVAYAVVVAVVALLLAFGRAAGALGTYSDTVTGNLLPNELHRALVEHAATLALGMGVLPFLVGAGWLLSSLVRPPSRELHAFASVGTFTLLALLVEVTIFDVRFGGIGVIRDRYLFYAAPIVLIAFACALVGGRWPRWSVVAVAAVVGTGFAVAALRRYEKLNVDTPAAVAHDLVIDAAGSTGAARALLVVATLLLAALFLQGTVLLRRTHLAALLALFSLATLVPGTAYAFHRLFAIDGTAGRPLTLDQSAVFSWIDRSFGTYADVTMVPYPHLPGEYWPSVAYWWDLEFWNKSVIRAAHYPGQFEWTPPPLPKLYLRFDPRTGRANASPTPYVAQSDKDTRFRIAGETEMLMRDVFLTEAEQPWRTDWLTFGLYADGWTRPGQVARVRVFAPPGQVGWVKRALFLSVRAPFDLERRPFTVRTNLGTWRVEARGDSKFERVYDLCLPPGGFTDVRITTPESSIVYGEMRDQSSFELPREAGVLLTQIALPDEVGGPCRPRRAG